MAAFERDAVLKNAKASGWNISFEIIKCELQESDLEIICAEADLRIY